MKKVLTYANQPGNVEAWRLGEACASAKPGGDPIDHGLSLLKELQDRGYGVVMLCGTDICGTPKSCASFRYCCTKFRPLYRDKEPAT